MRISDWSSDVCSSDLVMELLHSSGGTLGGEGSGHTICLDKTTTGDGLVTALQVLTAIAAQKKSLRELLAGVRLFPQVLINLKVQGRAGEILTQPAVRAAEAAAQARLGLRGRVLLRASGTEPLIREIGRANV